MSRGPETTSLKLELIDLTHEPKTLTDEKLSGKCHAS